MYRLKHGRTSIITQRLDASSENITLNCLLCAGASAYIDSQMTHLKWISNNWEHNQLPITISWKWPGCCFMRPNATLLKPFSIPAKCEGRTDLVGCRGLSTGHGSFYWVNLGVNRKGRVQRTFWCLPFENSILASGENITFKWIKYFFRR